jgi:hypothetical protein
MDRHCEKAKLHGTSLPRITRHTDLNPADKEEFKSRRAHPLPEEGEGIPYDPTVKGSKIAECTFNEMEFLL